MEEMVTRGIDAVEIGTTILFTKTIGESDVYGFAGITGDLHPNHVDEEYMKNSRYGHRVAHGVLIVGFMSTASTRLTERFPQYPSVSYGYDRVRFVKGVLIGDTIRVEYVVKEKDPIKNQLRSQITVTNQHGETVSVATHILQFL